MKGENMDKLTNYCDKNLIADEKFRERLQGNTKYFEMKCKLKSLIDNIDFYLKNYGDPYPFFKDEIAKIHELSKQINIED
jgi:hypothetical protein